MYIMIIIGYILYHPIMYIYIYINPNTSYHNPLISPLAPHKMLPVAAWSPLPGVWWTWRKSSLAAHWPCGEGRRQKLWHIRHLYDYLVKLYNHIISYEYVYIYTHNVLLFEFTTHPVGVTKKSQVDELAKTIGLKFRQDTAWCVMSGLQKRRFYLVLFHIYI